MSRPKKVRGYQVTKALENAGCNVRHCKTGSHMIGTGPDGSKMTYYEGELSTGVACKVLKWLKGFGILLALFLGMLVYLYC